MAPNVKLSLKLLVDKEKNEVVWAESNRDVVDVLFSFLTMPVGTIVRLLKKQSQLGCMDKLYESVEKLDLHFMETKACRTMLLHPRNAAGGACEDLKLNIDDSEPRSFYRCPKWECCSKISRLYSLVQDAKCPCGLTMDNKRFRLKKGRREDGVFVKGEGTFIISEGLRITPTSTEATLSVLREFGFKDCTRLEEMTLEIGKEEVLNLLKISLSSETPLTDVFLRKLDVINQDADNEKKDQIRIMDTKREAGNDTKRLKMKLLVSKSTNRVLNAEVGGDVVDLLFSFLTFPVGSIINLLDKCSCVVGCLDNLYESMKELIDTDYLVDSDECSRMLLYPKLAPMFASSSQLLRIEETASTTAWCHGCQDCFNLTTAGTKCTHGIAVVTQAAANPKLPNLGTESGGRFTKGREVFMITDELEVTPLSAISSVNTLGRWGISTNDLVVREVSLSELEAVNMLKASLTSNRVLSNIFSHRKRRNSVASKDLHTQGGGGGSVGDACYNCGQTGHLASKGLPSKRRWWMGLLQVWKARPFCKEMP